ncbi:YebC/PmpR family DNA-binding transcriptional regulator [Gammaproteobacteria bacterium]|jgi:YebC/PmpR family DNA-binding regulatory protein|nr:YebC/PmpR family DNA-binding transcriptional regulator [Gammaproteobacteria bacterium]
MAGHSKWANIKFRKAAQDSKRGKLFTKLIREITVSARAGGGDIASNPRLRTAIDKALGANMTRDTIDRAVKRGTGELEGVSYEEIRYEGYAPGGVAVLVDCMTDNRNRTVSEVRHIFSKHGGNLGTDGSVAYLFNKVGLFVFDSAVNEESVMEAAVGAGADDVETVDDGTIEVLTAPEAFAAVSAALNDAGLQAEVAELVQRPSNEAPVSEADAEKVMNLIDALEELDDVQEVATNASFQEGSAVAG